MIPRRAITVSVEIGSVIPCSAAKLSCSGAPNSQFPASGLTRTASPKPLKELAN
jgi:hypothetical protein